MGNGLIIALAPVPSELQRKAINANRWRKSWLGLFEQFRGVS